MAPYFNQLIILGNGFDLECRLNSQFKDYFATRESKPWLNCHNGSPWRGSENPKDPENVWDHIFQYEKANSPKTWTDVESIISKWVTKTESDQFNEAMASVNNRFSLLKMICAGVKGQMLPSSLPTRLSLSYNDHRPLLYNDLRLMESAFCDYLTKEASSQVYVRNAHKLYKTLAEADTGNQATESYVLSFNYTTPQPARVGSILDDDLMCWRNIHGSLGSNNIIFGIDADSLSNEQRANPEIRQFTKTYRVLTQTGQSSETETESLFNPIWRGESFQAIKFYGHSLGKADYSYFKSVFDRVNIYGSDTRLLFYYPSDHRKTKEELYPQIADLLNSYGESFPDASRGRNLMHKLLLEDRLSLREINVEPLNLQSPHSEEQTY